jgi:hypothetical protein
VRVAAGLQLAVTPARLFLTLALGPVVGLGACGGNDNAPAPGGQTGASCASEAECYPSVADKSTIQGEVQCLAKVPGGYCTHLCNADDDCCKAAGECGGHPEVCAPFENQAQDYCFLSCESNDVKSAGYTDATQYCHDFASAAFTCRSTGGGSGNRMICSAG